MPMMNEQGEVRVQPGRGRWRPDQDKIELRRPLNDGNVSVDEDPSNSRKMEKSDNLDVAAKSKLSVEAKEFIPRSSNFSSYKQAEQINNSDPGLAHEQHLDISHENLIYHLSDVIGTITCNPGKFDQLALPLVDELAPVLCDVGLVNKLVSLIVEQALEEHNFRYSGARLCCALSNAFQHDENSIFREVLLSRVSDIYQDVKNGQESNQSRIHGFVHFLGELYIQMGNENLCVLSTALLETFRVLLKTASNAGVKAVCEILKLAGRMLAAEKPKEIDTCFSDLRMLLKSATLDDRTKIIVKNIVGLFDNNWGQASIADTQLTPAYSSRSNISCHSEEIVMYGPDGLELTAEERRFLDESTEAPSSSDISGDDSDVYDFGNETTPEVMEEFEKFLRSQQTKP